MYRIICAFILALITGSVTADGLNVGNNCTLTWDNPDRATVDSTQVRGGQNPGDRTLIADVGNVYTAMCANLGLADGQWYVVVRAVNAGGEAGDSNEVPFFLGPPAAHSGLIVGP